MLIHINLEKHILITFSGIRKKVHALSKKKGCEVMGPWEQSINNHMYWVASSTPEDEPELRVAKWTSLGNHIQGIHEGHSEAFPRCLHGDLEPGRKKQWLKPGNYQCYSSYLVIICETSILVIYCRNIYLYKYTFCLWQQPM